MTKEPSQDIGEPSLTKDEQLSQETQGETNVRQRKKLRRLVRKTVPDSDEDAEEEEEVINISTHNNQQSPPPQPQYQRDEEDILLDLENELLEEEGTLQGTQIIPETSMTEVELNNHSMIEHTDAENSQNGAINNQSYLANKHASTLKRKEWVGQTMNNNTDDTQAMEDENQIEQREYNTDAIYIWGTDIIILEISQQVVNFMEHFKKQLKQSQSQSIDDKAYYMLKIIQVAQEEISPAGATLLIDAQDIHEFDDDLYTKLINYPQEVIPLFDDFVLDKYLNLVMSDEPSPITVRFRNLKEVKRMRDLEPADINHLVSLEGMVTRISDIIPDLRAGLFHCVSCKTDTLVYVNNGNILEPNRCKSCGEPHTLQLEYNRSMYADKQLIKVQETPETIPEGETPHAVSVSAFDQLVDEVKPGDRICITGIYRAVSARVNQSHTKMRNLFRTYIDVIHYETTGVRIVSASGDESLVAEKSEEASFSLEEEEAFQEFAKSNTVYNDLVASIAPSIFELDDVKKGILCQLFGGSNKSFENVHIRGEMHVLLVGDPGVSKSQLLLHVNKLAPRGVYTSGKGSSAVGLTAYITKDVETGEFVLESGALVLSDLGVCCIDEFDKMHDMTRSILHEVMEQQTVSVAKAGIVASLNARTSILAAANPIHSRYDEKLTITQNIRLMPTLLSRFDLIFILRDKPDARRDRHLARHIIQMYTADADSIVGGAPLDRHRLTRYISYAKRFVQPQITDQAAEALVHSYLDLRQAGQEKGKISATTRQLESLIRLSEAHAKMRLSKSVTVDDVDEALRLMKSAFRENMHQIYDEKTNDDPIQINLSLEGKGEEEDEFW
mmetsp:Transcript_2983/g.4364  ORF Transcript_2983/g.4364 Transcript_2983/m.4364 type:complete len:841 (+) Transcript_2983:27-2549(+)